jgi:tetratricopeptide (TPR) repeat protein
MTGLLVVCLLASDTRELVQITIRDLGAGRIQRALENGREAVDKCVEEFGTGSPAHARCLALYGQVLLTADMVDSGREHLEKAFEIANRRWLANDQDYIALRATLGAAYYLSKRAAQAEPLLRRALMGAEALLGADHREVGLILDHLAAALKKLGRGREAKELAARAASILGPAQSATVSAFALRNGR